MSSVLKAIAGVSLVALAVTGCQVSSDSDITGSGTFSLDVTDAPVDEANEVNVVFQGVEIQAANDGPRIKITYDEAKSINLLALQSGVTAPLLENETLAAGDYEWIRLMVGSEGSNIVIGDNIHPLSIPSGENTGLKLVSGFTVPVNDSVAFTIDFDLRKSVIEAPVGSYKLKPALRLLDNSNVGRISGFVSDTAINSMNGDCTVGASVYVFEGAGVTPTDVGGEIEPVSSAMVDPTQTGVTEYEYTAAFLAEGEYTIAFTCDADQDDPETGGETLEFVGTQNVTVTAGATATANF